MRLPARPARLLGLVAAVSLGGCPPPDFGPPPIGPDGATIWLEVGTGSDRFISLADGDELELVHGAQGGWHVDVAARISGMDPDGGTLRFLVLDRAGVVVAERSLVVTSRRLTRDGWTWTRTGDIVILSLPDPPTVLGDEIEVRAELEVGGVPVAADARRLGLVDRF